MQTETLVEAYKTIDEIAGWFQSFYNDVMATAPEYAEICGDLNALTYLLSEAQRHREQARAYLYDHFSDNHTPEAAAQYLVEPERCKMNVLGTYWTVCGAPSDGPCMC